MDRSLRFRVYATRLFALLGLAFASAPPCGLTSPRSVTRRPIMQKVRGHALPCGHSAPTACRHTVSGTISLPSPGFFSPFPRGTGSLSVDQEYLALEDGPPRFPLDCSCPAVLGCPLPRSLAFTYGAVTRYGRPSHAVQLARLFLTRPKRCHSPPGSHNPEPATLARLHWPGLGSSPFARRYSGSRFCFPFVQVLRCFSSLAWLPTSYEFARRLAGCPRAGFPIRKSPDHNLFAVPRSLSQLSTSFIASHCQGIHRAPFVA